MKDFYKKVFNSNLVKYIGLGYITTFLNVTISLLTIRYLEPFLLGKLSIGRSIFQSFEFSHFGIRNGLDRHLPGKGSQNVKNMMFSVAFYSSFIFSFLFVLFWLIYQKDDILFYSTFYFSGLVYSLLTIYRIYYRSRLEKSDFINISLIVNVLPLVGQIIGFYFFYLNGLIYGQLAAYVITYLMCRRFFRIKLVIRKKWVFPIFYKLFNSGFLLFLSAVLSFLSTVGDRFFIAEFWGLSDLGLYSVVLFVFSIFNIISVNYLEMILSNIIESKSFLYVVKQIFFIMTIVSILVLISFFLLPILVPIFLTKYLNILTEMKFMIFAAIPYAGLSILNHYLHAIDKRKSLLIINLICTILYFLGLYVILNHKESVLDLVILKSGFVCLIFCLTFIVSFIYSRKFNQFR